jgi:hypothetical protein
MCAVTLFAIGVVCCPGLRSSYFIDEQPIGYDQTESHAGSEPQLATPSTTLRVLCSEVQFLPQVSFIRLKYLEVKQGAEVIGNEYRKETDVRIVPVSELKCVAIRANASTTEDIASVLDHLDAAAKRHVGAFTEPPVRLREEEILVELYRWYKKHDQQKK